MDKPDTCSRCPLFHVTNGFCPPLDVGSDVLIVGEAPGKEEVLRGLPFVGGAGRWLDSLFRASKQNRNHYCIANTVCCNPPHNIYPGQEGWSFTTTAEAKQGIAYCLENFLYPFVKSRSWQKIIAMGEQALRALTPRSGITLWRGSPLPLIWERLTGPNRVIPTYHPAYLMRDSKYFSVVCTVDMVKDPQHQPPEHYTLYPTIEDLQNFREKEFAFDFEWDRSGNILLCGLSGRYYHALTVPWTSEFIPELKRIFENADLLIGHNIIGADSIHLERLGWNIHAQIADTLLMQHLIQPDFPHSLRFVASVFTSKTMWKGEGGSDTSEDKTQWKTWENLHTYIPRELGGYGGCKNADEAFRLYNARDCDASLQCYYPIVSLLKENQLYDVYENVSVPIAYICRDMSQAGLKLDNQRVRQVRFHLMRKLVSLDRKLPPQLRSRKIPITKNVRAPQGTYKPKTKTCSGNRKNKTLHPPVTITFHKPGPLPCPTCGHNVASGKMTTLKVVKVAGFKRTFPWNSPAQVLEYAKSEGLTLHKNIKTENLTSNKAARKKWHRELLHRTGENTATVFTLLDEIKIADKRLNTFAKSEYLTMDRIYFKLNPAGTSEGRLSCSGMRKGIDPNIQQQPKEIRKIYIPDYPDWGFISADIVQGENTITAWLAKDYERLERLLTPGYDEHAFMAGHFFNIPWEQCKKGGPMEYMRGPGKIINHGRNYGLGVNKTLEYLIENGYSFTLSDVREMIEIWKKINKKTYEWQTRIIGIVKQQSYLVNPFGRKRWFLDRDYATKALAFLPASTLADAVFRMMIALQPDRWISKMAPLGIEIFGYLPPLWSQRIQVHDEITLQGPAETWRDAASLVRSVMTQPWRDLDGFRFQVEIGWSGAGKSWGDVKTVEEFSE